MYRHASKHRETHKERNARNVLMLGIQTIPDAKLKFLVKEVLHGVGGFVFDANGNRVANEIGGQNCETGEMWKNKPPFSLSL